MVRKKTHSIKHLSVYFKDKVSYPQTIKLEPIYPYYLSKWYLFQHKCLSLGDLWDP